MPRIKPAKQHQDEEPVPVPQLDLSNSITVEQHLANQPKANKIDEGVPWPRGFFDCCGDLKSCCCGVCCYCYLHASNATATGTGQCGNSTCGTCCLLCVCCAPAHCFITRNTREVIRIRYDLEERAAGCGCCDGDCCSHCCWPCCASVQEARTLAFFAAKGEPFDKEKVYQEAPGQVSAKEQQTVQAPVKPKKKSGYGNLPPHHPAAKQAANVSKREEIAAQEAALLLQKCEKRMTRGSLWNQIEHAKEFAKPGTKLALKSSWKKYMDAQRHGVSCDQGLPKWWEVGDVDQANGTPSGGAVCIRFKKKILRGEGGPAGAMQVLPPPCADEWKAIFKGVGKYLLMNEEGLFLKCEKDGSLAMCDCNPEDINSFRPFIWEVKFK